MSEPRVRSSTAIWSSTANSCVALGEPRDETVQPALVRHPALRHGAAAGLEQRTGVLQRGIAAEPLGDRLELVEYAPRTESLRLQRDSEALLLLVPDAGGRGKG
ncbi:MAG: hypothetical protein ACRDKY_09010, partial [Solirubrobacteraceae bacterium]